MQELTIKSETVQPLASRRGLEDLDCWNSEDGNIRGRSDEVRRVVSATNGEVTMLATIAGADENRPCEAQSQLLQSLQEPEVDGDLRATRTSELLQYEVIR